MEAKTKKTIMWVAVGALVLFSGIYLVAQIKPSTKDLSGGHINRSKDTGEILDDTMDEDGVLLKPVKGGGDVVDHTGNGITYPATPFANSTEGNAFRKWVNDKHSDWAKANSLDASGGYDNKYIRKAYSIYGTEYKSAPAGNPIIVGTPVPSSGIKVGDNLIAKNKVAIFTSISPLAQYSSWGSWVYFNPGERVGNVVSIGTGYKITNSSQDKLSANTFYVQKIPGNFTIKK